MISIIVPIYNVEKYLDDCIKSIVNQTYQDIEIILINDGSTDRSAEICDQWAQRDPRVRVYHQNNCGVSETRNRGIAAASGEYLYFVDSDDYIDPNTCEKAIQCFSDPQVDIVVFRCAKVSESCKVLETEPYIDCNLDRLEALSKIFSGNIKSYPCNKIIKRTLWEGIQFPIGRHFEDLATLYKVFLKSNKVCCIPDVLYYYRRRGGSITAQMSTKSLRDLFLTRIEIYDDMYRLYPDIADKSSVYIAKSAKAFIDRSLWDNYDPQTLVAAEKYLNDHKDRILKLNIREINFYLRFPALYRTYRKLKHVIGNIVKAFIK